MRTVKKYLQDAGVDTNDLLERADWIEKFNSVRIGEETAAIEKAKAKANAAYGRRSFEFAVRLYTEAALAACALHELDAAGAAHFVAVVLANRSLAFLNLQLPARAPP